MKMSATKPATPYELSARIWHESKKCASLILAGVLVCACGNSKNHEGPPNKAISEEGPALTENSKYINASNEHFQLRMEWEPSSDRRRITAAGKDFESGTWVQLPTFAVDLIKRPSPWIDSSLPGTTMTRFGPYMPGAQLLVDNDPWDLVVMHEVVDFPSRSELAHFLKSRTQYHPESFALDRFGNFVEFQVSTKGKDILANSLSITVYYLYVDGDPPAIDLLNDAIRGDVRTNHDSKFKEPDDRP